MKTDYGVAVLAEGLIESIGEKGLVEAMDQTQLGRYGKVARDPHGHLRLGEIEFGRMIKDRLIDRLEQLGLPTTLHRQGPGLRIALRRPDPVRCGVHARPGLRGGEVPACRRESAQVRGHHQLSSAADWMPLPFEQMINPETRRMQNRKVDVDGEGYECARRYMIRLDERDFRRAAAPGPPRRGGPHDAGTVQATVWIPCSGRMKNAGAQGKTPKHPMTKYPRKYPMTNDQTPEVSTH